MPSYILFGSFFHAFFMLRQKIIQQIKDSNEKLRLQIKVAENERRRLLELIDGDGANGNVTR
jgi:hypothetical protein